MFSLRSYTLPSGGPLRNSQEHCRAPWVCLTKRPQSVATFTVYESKPNSASHNVWGEPSSGNHCLDYDTIHHSPSAEFQRVMVEPLS